MKRLMAALGVWCLLAGAAYASPTLGTWTAPSDFDAGSWQTDFGFTTITASGANWSLTNTTLASGGFGSATYGGGVLTGGIGGPWDGGDAPYTVAMSSLTLLSSVTGIGKVSWELEGSGVVNGTGEIVHLQASVNNGSFTLMPGGVSGAIDWVEISIQAAPGSTIPAPGAILLGVLGASGVGWLRRRGTL